MMVKQHLGHFVYEHNTSVTTFFEIIEHLLVTTKSVKIKYWNLAHLHDWNGVSLDSC